MPRYQKTANELMDCFLSLKKKKVSSEKLETVDFIFW